MTDESLTDYYAKRAATYEAIYDKPERQTDLLNMTAHLQSIFRGKNLLEIACGTGYWTQKIAETATHIHATDINEPVLEIARTKHYAQNNVQFQCADLYDIQPEQAYEALFGGFIWSHIKREDLGRFVGHVHTLVQPGGQVVFADNRYVTGSSTPIAATDANGNTYQKRQLQDGSPYDVLKNFPTPEEIMAVVGNSARHFRYTALPYFWICAYQPI